MITEMSVFSFIVSAFDYTGVQHHNSEVLAFFSLYQKRLEELNVKVSKISPIKLSISTQCNDSSSDPFANYTRDNNQMRALFVILVVVFSSQRDLKRSRVEIDLIQLTSGLLPALTFGSSLDHPNLLPLKFSVEVQHFSLGISKFFCSSVAFKLRMHVAKQIQ